MRIFLSHNINLSKNRPDRYRDSEDDVAALEALGKQLADAGFRVFEYQFQRTETQTQDILFMMARQIALADVVVFVATREAYDAPGWCVPELFHALAHRKEILCCALRDVPFTGERFGDTSNPRRFRILLPPSTPIHSPESLLEYLKSARQSRSTKTAPNLFDLTEDFLAWRTDQPTVTGSIESLLETYASAWEIGFRPARNVLSPSLSAPSGTFLAKISGWIDDDHLGVVWEGSSSAAFLTLFDTTTDSSDTIALPPGVDPLGVGTSESGAPVVFTHDNSGGLRFWCSSGDFWESFDTPFTPAVFTGVIGDRWFSGSDLFRLDWENQRLVPETPTPKDWAVFRRFYWFGPPQEDDRALSADSYQPLLFATQPEHWTLLPSYWRSLQGDSDDNGSRLVVWDNSRVLFGDLGSANSFGERLPKVRTTEVEPQPPKGNNRPPNYLAPLCAESNATAPAIAPSRIETEDILSLSWTASHLRLRSHFTWSLSLGEARKFLDDLLSIPAPDS